MKSVLFSILMMCYLSALGETETERSRLVIGGDSDYKQYRLTLKDPTGELAFTVARVMMKGEPIAYHAEFIVFSNRVNGALPDKPLILRAQFSQITLPYVPQRRVFNGSMEIQQYAINAAQIKSLGTTNHWRVMVSATNGPVSFEVEDFSGKISEFVQVCAKDRPGEKVTGESPKVAFNPGVCDLRVMRSTVNGAERAIHILALPDQVVARVLRVTRVFGDGLVRYNAGLTVSTNQAAGILADQPLELKSGPWRVVLTSEPNQHSITEKDVTQFYRITPAQVFTLGNTNWWQISFSTKNETVTYEAKDPDGKLKEFADISASDPLPK